MLVIDSREGPTNEQSRRERGEGSSTGGSDLTVERWAASRIKAVVSLSAISSSLSSRSKIPSCSELDVLLLGPPVHGRLVSCHP